MRSIEKDSSYENGSQKVLRILKINHPVAKDVVDKMTNKYLLPKGVEKNKIEQNLTAHHNESNSSRKRRNPSTSSFVCQGITTCLSRAVSKGSSFCEIDDVVKRLSFVFLVVSQKMKVRNCMLSITKGWNEIAEEVILKSILLHTLDVDVVAQQANTKQTASYQHT